MTKKALYVSTRGDSSAVDFQSAILNGLAPDGGLYCPQNVPDLSGFLNDPNANPQLDEIGGKLIEAFAPEVFSKHEIEEMIGKAWGDFGTILEANMPLQMKPLATDEYILELFHGPTLAFKDFGMRLLAQMFDKLIPAGKTYNIIVATSGDTGAAAAQAFAGASSIRAYILYPKSGISDLQRLQMTTSASDNIFPLEVDGSFDECQINLKKILVEKDSKIPVLSVNSVNFGRLIAQMSYYIWSWFALDRKPLSIVVPSGNFGNALSCYYCHLLGVDICELILAVNANNTLERFITSGDFATQPVRPTLSNAMDVAIPSNLERLIWLIVNQDSEALKLKLQTKEIAVADLVHLQLPIRALSIDDSLTVKVMHRIYEKFDYVIDPHTAVAAAVSHRFEKHENAVRLILSTAHPAKFENTLKLAQISTDFSSIVNQWKTNAETYHCIDNSYTALNDFIHSHQN